MTHQELRGLTDKLETKANSLLKGLMNPFQGDGICCPWLRRYVQSGKDYKPKGLLLMQDWGNAEQPIAEAINEIEGAVSAKPIGDRTLKNLMSPKRAWGKAIQDGSWLVSNAVWGLRQGNNKCGCLESRIHRAALPIWIELVGSLSQAAEGDFALVVAGDWAVFADEFRTGEGCLDLPAYLNLWIDWLGSSLDNLRLYSSAVSFKESRGVVYHVPHPATWGSGSEDLMQRPPVLRERPPVLRAMDKVRENIKAVDRKLDADLAARDPKAKPFADLRKSLQPRDEANEHP